MIAAGFVIGFSSCAGALSQIGGGGSRVAGNILVFGFFAGAVLFLAGIVAMMIVVVRALITEPQGGVISRGTHPQLFPDSVESGASQTESAGAALWRFRIAVIVSMALGAMGLFTGGIGSSPYFGVIRGIRTIPLLVVSYALSQVPYGIAIYRNRNGGDRAGLGLALATGLVSLIGSWSVLRYAFLLSFWTGLKPIADAAVVAFAWLARKDARPLDDEAGRIVAFFFGVLIYFLVLRILTPFLAIKLR